MNDGSARLKMKSFLFTPIIYTYILHLLRLYSGLITSLTLRLFHPIYRLSEAMNTGTRHITSRLL